MSATKCRTCLSHGTSVFDLFKEKLSSDTILANYVSYICKIQISKTDGLSSSLCLQCYEIVKKCYEFTQTVRKCDEFLRKERRNVQTLNRKVICKRNIYTCDVCKISFRSKILRNNHRKEHSASFQCDICEKLFKRRKTLQVHKRCHTRGDPVTCNICQKSYRDKGLFIRHIRTAHSGESHSCPACDAVFPHRSRLQTHIRFAHPDTGEASMQKFSCSTCLAVFKRSHHLRRHEKLHGIAKPYLCSVCGKGFSQSQYLKIHLREHNNGPMWVCEIDSCRKMFVQASSLKRHMLSHQGSKDWLCSSCGGQYLTAATLRKHQMHPNACCADLPPPKHRTVVTNNQDALRSDNLKKTKTILEIVPNAANMNDKISGDISMIEKPTMDISKIPINNKMDNKDCKLFIKKENNIPEVQYCHLCKQLLTSTNVMRPNSSNTGLTKSGYDLPLCETCQNTNPQKPQIQPRNKRSLLLPLNNSPKPPENSAVQTTNAPNYNVSQWLNTFVPVDNQASSTILYILEDDFVECNNVVSSGADNAFLQMSQSREEDIRAPDTAMENASVDGQNIVNLLLANMSKYSTNKSGSY